MNRYNLIGVINSRESTPSLDKLFQLESGKIKSNIELVNGQYRLYYINSDEKQVVLFDSQSGILKYLDNNLNFISSYDLPTNSSLFLEDLNDDGKNEFALISLASGQISVYDLSLNNLSKAECTFLLSFRNI